MSIINIHSNIKDYSVKFFDSEEFIADLSKKQDCVFAVDQKVWDIYQADALCYLKDKDLIFVRANEKEKTLKGAQKIYDQLITKPAKRNLTLVTIGGGILQDVTGFVASTLYRGIQWELIPTTLLAQADSCIGSKTSLNYNSYKNLLGTFYPPNGVSIYTQFLKTLSELDYYSGLGEVIKLHIMGGNESTRSIVGDMAELQLRNPAILHKTIEKSLMIKLGFLSNDEFDLGTRNFLNYGHCFGHAIESATKFSLPHGQAVILGMILANLISYKRGLLSENKQIFLYDEILIKGLAKKEIKNLCLDSDKIINSMKNDKKRIGQGLVLIMLCENYEFIKATDLSETEINWALEELIHLMNGNINIL
jgi:3-dehydroquinate synthase